VTPTPLELALSFKGRRITPADIEELSAFWHPEIEWHTRWPGADPVYVGFEGVRRWVREIGEGADFTQEILDVVELDPNRLLLTCRLRAHGHSSGLDLESNIYDVWTFRDGLLIKRETFADESSALEAAGVDRGPG
jgi:ketosteroid isomerase-like protein